MASNETHADIVREMVEFGNHCAAFGGAYSPERWDNLCKRLNAAHNRELAAKDDERLTVVAIYENVIAAKDREIAELKDCILKEIDWLKRMIRDDLEGWATSMWSPSDEFRKHTFSRLIEDNTYHIERMKKALKGSNNATK